MKTKVLALGLALAVIWGLKRHYADSRADDLLWILRPTAALVGAVTNTTFAIEPGQGFLSRDRLFLIEKSCAGINFMIAAFGMLAFALRRRISSCVSGAGVLGLSLISSYVAAVAVNAARITVAMWLGAHPGAVSTLSAAQLHRVEGIIVYFAGLVLLYELARQLDGAAAVAGKGR